MHKTSGESVTRPSAPESRRGNLPRLPFVAADHQHGPSPERQATQAVVVSAVALGIAAVIEFAAASNGRSAGVLADALHNAGDVLTTLVLLVAFAVARRPATRRFTSGFGRVEDVATLVIILIIVFTAAAAALESIGRLLSTEGYSIGPNYCSALAVLALTVEYRFLPIYQRGEEPADR